MKFIVGLIVLVLVAGGCYVGYMKFVKGEDVTLEDIKDKVADVDVDVEINPYTKGEGYFRTTKYEDAIGEYRKVINANTDAEKVEHSHFRIAQCYEAAKMYPQAIQAYKGALKKYPQSQYAEKAKKAAEKLELERG